MFTNQVSWEKSIYFLFVILDGKLTSYDVD